MQVGELGNGQERAAASPHLGADRSRELGARRVRLAVQLRDRPIVAGRPGPHDLAWPEPAVDGQHVTWPNGR